MFTRDKLDLDYLSVLLVDLGFKFKTYVTFQLRALSFLTLNEVSGLNCMQLREPLIDKLNFSAFEYPASEYLK